MRAKASNWTARRMADWVGGASRTLRPLVEALKSYVLSAEKLHGDDVPVPVLEPGNGKTKTGRLWTYVRDDRPAGSDAASAVWFAYSPDRKGEHPAGHLKNYRGILQADGYAGFNRLYETGAIVEAACWAHVRRKFFDLHQGHASPVAKEALERIAQLYGIEKEIRGRSPDERREVRQARSRPLLEAMHAWLKATMSKLSKKSELAKAIHYALERWTALMVFVDDGRVEMDNNAAERALRTVAIGRKNYLFAGSDAGGERAAAIYSLLGSAKLNGIDPEAYMTAVLRRIADHPDQPDRGTAALESVPGGCGEGRGGMTLKTTSIEIVSTIAESWTRFKMRQGLPDDLAAARIEDARRRSPTTRTSRSCTCDSARPAMSIATSSSRPRSIRPSSTPSPRAASSSLTSATATPTSAWPNSAPLNLVKTAFAGRLRFIGADAETKTGNRGS